ncbi:hypothetical protein GCM10010116_01180 [Microbispora rosea subsp. aerata]|nr:phosphopantetheine-binding protein [Microbispora rosea]GGO00752.1 hypothetical protein GCM10010116_01180 [Microbispora rosea subsp. aerata]GIH56869.1 hypothetical protein Mro02_37830 [Microbispora rosea subsp. aerata]GLJ84354.1 hypothetical protein GCM10017588_30820 [Microbispora rosea subsp. aerata]
MTAEEYTRRLAQMVSEASDGAISVEEVLKAGHTLSALGLTPLGRIRLITAIEDEFGVKHGLGDELASVEDVGTLSALVALSAMSRPAATAHAAARSW